MNRPVINQGSFAEIPPGKKIENRSPENGAFRAAFRQLERVLVDLSGDPMATQNAPLFISTSLEFARTCFVLGKGFDKLIVFLKDALKAAAHIGDLRSQAMLKLHLGRLWYFAEKRDKAMEMFARGKAEVDALGDDDIAAQASELIGLFYFIQGDFLKAREYFERATKLFDFGDYGHSGPMWLSYCYAFLGQYHRAIGTLDYYRRKALERGNRSLATTLRAVLGIVLLGIKKSKESTFHLSGALQEAVQAKNDLAAYFCRGGLSFHHMMEGRLEESREWLSAVVAYGEKLGLIRQYASPFVLETLYEYKCHGLAPIVGFTFESETQRILQDPNKV